MGLYEDFNLAFERLEQEKCIQLASKSLQENEITVIDLYENVLKRALSNLSDVETDINHKIWKEHIQSGIIRTIIEMANPYVLNYRKEPQNKRAAVLCPDGEQHELGARMVSDYIRMMGYETYFVGRDTPRDEIHDLISVLSLDLIAISVTNYYNLTKTIQMVDFIQSNFPTIKLIIGGRGIDKNSDIFNSRKVDVAHTIDDLQSILGHTL